MKVYINGRHSLVFDRVEFHSCMDALYILYREFREQVVGITLTAEEYDKVLAELDQLRLAGILTVSLVDPPKDLKIYGFPVRVAG